MISPGDVLQSRPCSFAETRGDRTLLVWGDVGQWLVVDAEAAALIAQFHRPRRVGDALATFKSRAEAIALLEVLAERGLVGRELAAPTPPADPLRLSNLTFNLTDRCNLRCAWCYNAADGGDEIPVADFLAWLSAGAAELGPDTALVILGGEPFLDPTRLAECVGGTRKLLASEILVSTNGTLPVAAVLPALRESKTTVQISMDSPVASRHDAIRGRGTHAKAAATARRLAEAGVHTVLSMVMTAGSEEHFEAYFDLAVRLDVDEVRLIPLRRLGRGSAHAAEAPDLVRCFQTLAELLRRRPGLARRLHRDFFSILATACGYSRLRSNCGIGRRSLFVDSHGDIFPCPNRRESSLCCGNVRSMPLAGLLEASPTLATVRAECGVEQSPQCRACALRYWCAGDCRAEALAVAGTLQAPSPYCGQLQVVIREMLWMYAEGRPGFIARDEPARPWS